MRAFDPRLPIIATEAKVRPTHVFFVFHALREGGKQFHPAACAHFAGLEERHVLAIVEALTNHDALPTKRSVPSKRAERLPDDWTPPAEWLDWASEARKWEPAVCVEEAANFACYWQAKSGKDATKLDWQKTWQNWCRNSRRPDGDYRKPEGPMGGSPEQIEKTAALYERMGRTVEAAEMRRRLADNVLPFRKEA